MKPIILEIKPTKWIDNKKRKPLKGGEYNIVWNIDDNKYPVTTSADYDSINKKWSDIKNYNTDITNQVLYWSNIPKAPKNIPKSIWYNKE